MYVFETKVPHILLLYISYSTSDATFPVPHIRESYQKGNLCPVAQYWSCMRSILWWLHADRCRSKFVSYM